MRRQFYQIAIGMLLIAVDLRAGSFDLLPDFIGYLLVCLAAEYLREEGKDFAVVTASAALGVLVALPDLIGFDPAGILSTLLTAVGAVVTFEICTGIMKAGAARGNAALAAAAQIARTLTLVAAFVTIGFAFFDWLVRRSDPLHLLAIPVALFALAVGVAVILLAIRAGRELAPAPALYSSAL